MTDNANPDIDDTTAPADTEKAGNPTLSTAKWVTFGVITAGAALYAKDKVQGFRARRAAKKAAVDEPDTQAPAES